MCKLIVTVSLLKRYGGTPKLLTLIFNSVGLNKGFMSHDGLNAVSETKSLGEPQT